MTEGGRLVAGGRYRLLGPVAAGGQGTLHLALDLQHDRRVAIKVRSCTSDAEREDALGEAKLLLSIRPHERLPLVRDDFFWEGNFHLVMDWVEGRNLGSVVRSAPHGRLEFEEAIGYLDDLAGALDHLHRQDPPVMHGDVKPENVVIDQHGCAVLVDLGSGRGGSGTPVFQAPEAMRGLPTVAADVYGLAATAHFALTGMSVLQDAPVDVGLPPAHAARLFEALRRGLAIDPARRPASAGELLDALRPPLAKHDLPPVPTSFVGRADELRRLSQSVTAGTVATLIGAGGAGKTRLAFEGARRLLHRFEEVFAVELAAVEPASAALEAVAAVVGVVVSDEQSLLPSLIERLRRTSALLIIDNAEHFVEAVADIAASLIAELPTLAILVTSREPLRVPGERVLVVGPLPVAGPEADATLLAESDAVRLFRDRAAQAGGVLEVDDDAAVRAAAEVCRRLDGAPLAIEMAAGLAWRLTPQEVLASLVEDYRSLEGMRTAPVRHRTLADVLEWSVQLLSEEEYRMLRGLSVFAGSFTTDAAVSVSDCPRNQAAVMLDAFCRRSLLTATGLRYRLSETVRTLLRERLHEAGEYQQAVERLCRFYLDLSAGPGSSDGTGAVADAENHRVALEHLRATAASADLAQLVSGLWGSWSRIGRLREGAAWVDEALDAIDPDSVWRARLLLGSGVLAFDRGDYATAYEQALASAEAAAHLGDLKTRAEALGNAGNAAVAQGRLGEAERPLLESLEFQRAAGEHRAAAKTLNTLAIVADQRGELDLAVERYTATLDAGRELGDPQIEFIATVNLGALYHLTGRLAAAEATLLTAMELARRLEFPRAIAHCLLNLSLVRDGMGDPTGAVAQAEEAVDIGREIGDTGILGQGLANLTYLYRQTGDFERAVATGGEAIEVGDANGDLVARIAARANFGAALTALGRLIEAKPPLLTAERLAEESELAQMQGLASYFLGELALAEGGVDEAAVRLRNALRMSAAAGDADGVAQVLTSLLDVATRRRDQATAVAVARAAAGHPETSAPGIKRRAALLEAWSSDDPGWQASFRDTPALAPRELVEWLEG